MSHGLAGDTLNGVQFHPFLPLVATASGDLSPSCTGLVPGCL